MLKRVPLSAGSAAAAALLVVLLLCRPSRAQGLSSRDPYLQNDQGSSITVCWTTVRPMASQVWLRQPSQEAARRFADEPPGHRHQVTLSPLQPGGTYEYQVATDQGTSPWHRFHTRPKGSVPFRFAVFGDMGDGSPAERTVERLLEQEAPDFAFALGDLAYPSAQEATLTQHFFHPLARYAAEHVIWHVFGNHDVAAQGGRPLEAASVVPTDGPMGLPPCHNYSWNYGDAHFVVLDSNLSPSQLRTRIAPWLEMDLSQSNERWKFVMMHHPPFSTGPHGNTARLDTLLVPLFSRRGVTAVFSGHDHDYERFKPIDGVVYVVSGDGGAGLYRFKRSDLNLVKRDDLHHGLTLVDIDGTGARLRHITTDGSELDRAELAPRSP
ncbi:MAG: metallophosphoesterase family protein [Armatimonadetes bacterium]|nr:metallophosphoesterase family protein [Armatimonadota bacterium]